MPAILITILKMIGYPISINLNWDNAFICPTSQTYYL